MVEETKKPVNKGGRPKKKRGGPKPVMTPEKITLLEEAFAFDCTDAEACYYAGISERTLHYYQAKNPKFLQRKKLLKERPVLKARHAVIDSFDTHPDIAFRYLEKKKRDEFGPDPANTQGLDFIAAMINAAKEAVSERKRRDTQAKSD